MFQSIEIRWFFQGEIPEPIHGWFHPSGEREPPAVRTDHYLHIPDTDSLGIKLREGRMEVKQRIGEVEVWKLNEQVQGSIEQWQKWSYALNDAALVGKDLGEYPDRWIGVEKQRWLKMFAISDEGEVHPARPGIYLDNGCGWELTNVKIKGVNEAWWTIGFEAFGDQSRTKKTLHTMLRTVFSGQTGVPFVLQASKGYPKWIIESAAL
jgi:hypothetical protein